MASHATVLRRAFSDDADPKAIGRDWAARWADALYRSIEIRERYPASRFLDIYYEDIVRAPFSTLEKIYDFIGAPFSADARSRMQAFLEANPKNKHGKHVYSLGEFGLSDREEIERYAEYCDRFDIEVQRTT
jgi:hypothetical protein